MDSRLFEPGLMHLKKQLLTIPYSKRFYYDPEHHILFENLEGIKLRTPQDVRELVFYAEQKLKEIAALNKPGTNYTNKTLTKYSTIEGVL
jgi:hypothetical protein